ncbi:MAG: FtsW/RodA/SpoVE family cell cycle protein [Acidobacteria bacterium]|nr:FtsW/RodA/SpoVE family cell cycle protein [Acidobacteriota bacterium]
MTTTTVEPPVAAHETGSRRERAVTTLPASHRPSLHLLLVASMSLVALAAHAAVISAGALRGFDPSVVVAVRNVALFVPLVGVVLWLGRSQRYRGSMVLYSAAVLLFTLGLSVQYRLFTDPEYGARGIERREAREAKAQTIRYLNIRTGYSDEKKAAIFGSTQVPDPPPADARASEYSIGDILTSTNTWIPLIGLAGFCVAFRLFRSDNFLLWLQRHTMTIALATLLPFALAVIVFSSEGKFLGQTTPWEPVKIVFLVAYAAMLADAYRHLGRTRWGIPQARFSLPFAVVAAIPMIPFFVLSDFGQMLVFFGVYAVLYAIAVRSKVQLAWAVALVLAFAPLLYLGFGVPGRVNLRFHLWLNTWQAPPEDTGWWQPFLARKRADYGFAVSNDDAWYDQSSQLAQGLFGIADGGFRGQGLGLGYPEIVPVSDSDFIYAAIGEEFGLLGGIAVLLALAAFVWSGTVVAIGARDMFTKLMAAGFTAFVGFQSLVNIGGVVRMLPMTGITLPFVSHGGWSLITSFAMLGVLMAIAHRNAVASGPE